MSISDLDQGKISQEQELRIQRQIAFASGLFQGDVTVRTLLESLAEGVVIVDTSGTILLVNTTAEHMFGYSREELVGKPHAILIPERLRGVHEEHQAHYFAEPRLRSMGELHDLAGRRRDGSEFPVEISLSFIETINGVLVMAFVSDITLRKQYESRLRESEELFHTQVECVKDYAIFMLDADGNVLNWNAGAERLKGYQGEEIIGKPFSCFYPEEERSAGKPEEQLERAQREGRVAADGWRVRKDGSRFWADIIITALRLDDGNLRGFSTVTHDITERKRAEDALRFSEERFRALYRDNPTMIATIDAELTMLSVNPFCASQLGYTIDELEGQPVLKIFHEDDRPALAEQLRRCLQNPARVYQWQFRKVRKDGGLLWVEEIAQAVYDLNGALNILVVCQDITDRKRTEDALRESEERFRATFNQAAVGMGLMTPDSRWMRINQRYCDIVGYTEEELKALTIKDITHPDDREESLKQFHLLLEGRIGNYSLEKRYIRKDGSIVWVNITASMVADADGKPRFAVGVVEDITSRKQAEEALVRAKNEWELTFDSVQDLIAILDDQYRITRLNRAMAKRLGRKPEECIGLVCYNVIHGTESPPEFCPHIKTLDDGRVHDAEVHDGHLAGDFLVSTTPLLDPDGKMIGVVHMARDITERKRADEEIERLNTDLAARADELEAANRELEAFNYTVAHDLRKPLTVVNGYCQAIHEMCGDKLCEQCTGYLREAYDGTLRMNGLIEALLNFSRLVHLEPRREMVDLSHMAHEVETELKLAEPERRVKFRITDGVSADGDAGLLRVVLDNLLGNAWKYTDKREEGVIEFGVTEIEGKPAWFVRDNGTGFDMADADKLFAPFQRLPGVEECRGFGIGLATVERIIRRHGGRVWAEGEAGKRATFYFTLGGDRII
ncbi:PAS domain S-box protein [Geotalea uraniireducens]|uniref:histidine kinase n=1 Tax=Geotalea uraniireducens (strain Rf4) TaxID=351605 RepID=A5GFJ9_GEOUR|nr:PAS domain S-box protein [Geotalea uraniireducens]ABQ26204.1 PAS/PAC sensor signal transduction histidine kinase [Geotalea uraniireducens Rf4]